MVNLTEEQSRCLITGTDPAAAIDIASALPFHDVQTAAARFSRLCNQPEQHELVLQFLPGLIDALEQAPSPDAALLNFERLVQAVPDRNELFRRLGNHPRSLEILFRIFVGSQFLTDILIRRPEWLARLSDHRRLAEFKSRQQFIEDANAAIDEVRATGKPLSLRIDAVRRVQKWELMRIATCDSLHLMDLKTVTLQLSLLADAVVQSLLDEIARDLRLDASGFVVIAFGKLGGEELNYSSDIDLVFLCEDEAQRYWKLAQRLVQALNETAQEGFLYRVDMRLRPWGRSGPLAVDRESWLTYLHRHAELWEKQALLKARPIAGNIPAGERMLAQAEPLLFDTDPEAVRRNVVAMKQRIESENVLSHDDDVKAGPGGIRDVEFLTQYLQLVYSSESPALRSRNTLDSLIRLADHELILPGEYRHLSSGYVFQRTVEHSLQLMHNKQQHVLPRDERELRYLSRRLDFPGPEQFLEHYRAHRAYVRDLFVRRLVDPDRPPRDVRTVPLAEHFGEAAREYSDLFGDADIERHQTLLAALRNDRVVVTDWTQLPAGAWQLTVAGYDRLGDLSLMAGLLFISGCDIESGFVFTGAQACGTHDTDQPPAPKFLNVFLVRSSSELTQQIRDQYDRDLEELMQLASEGQSHRAQGLLARRVGTAIRSLQARAERLLPVEIAIDNDVSPTETVLHIHGEDTPGFLYELTNALALSGISIRNVRIRSERGIVLDTLYVTSADGEKITDRHQLIRLRAAIVLTKQFTHLLPNSPNPESAMLHFRDLLQGFFAQSGWIEQLSTLQAPDVLTALARLLGGSDFLWQDFLRLQHSSLFPLITNRERLKSPKSPQQLSDELDNELQAVAGDLSRQQHVLNDFKDREMFRVDMRHILDLQQKFGMFSRELTDVAEVVIQAAVQLAQQHLRPRHGWPLTASGSPVQLAVCGLGKFGGRELGFASDIELMFLYSEEGRSDGPQPLDAADFFSRLIDLVRKSIRARRQGIFELDLRLRPYGRAGKPAVSLRQFREYFGPDGAAWPYERQALVKLRPIAGNDDFGNSVVTARDELIYRNERFNVAAMRAMRQRQITEQVPAGTFNAKLSDGGLVDCEYFVQALQMTFGHLSPALREPNTRGALRALEEAGLIPDRRPLRDAYRFLRRVIDALRMVRGNARDLTVPAPDSEEFLFLARRLNIGSAARLSEQFERHTRTVRQEMRRLDEYLDQSPAITNPPIGPSPQLE